MSLCNSSVLIYTYLDMANMLNQEKSVGTVGYLFQFHVGQRKMTGSNKKTTYLSTYYFAFIL